LNGFGDHSPCLDMSVRYANTTSGLRFTVIVQVWTDIAHPPLPQVLVAVASSHQASSLAAPRLAPTARGYATNGTIRAFAGALHLREMGLNHRFANTWQTDADSHQSFTLRHQHERRCCANSCPEQRPARALRA
jgi:hypothetical protein